MEDIALGLQLRLVEGESCVAPRRMSPSMIASSTAFESTGTGTEIPRSPESPCASGVGRRGRSRRCGCRSRSRSGRGRSRSAGCSGRRAPRAARGGSGSKRGRSERPRRLLLEVDALAQTVGRNEDAFGSFAEGEHALLALRRRQLSRHCCDLDASELGPQRVGEVVRGRDEAAEDDRVVAVGDELLDERDTLLELRVAVARARRPRGRGRSGRRFGSSGSSPPRRPRRGDVDALADSSSTRSRTSRLPTSSASSTVTVSAVRARFRSVEAAAGLEASARRSPSTAHAHADGGFRRRRDRRRSRAHMRAPSRRALDTRGERVRRLGHLPARERRVAQEVLDVAAAALHHLASEPATLSRALVGREVVR